MKRYFFIALALGLAGCNEQDKESRTMDAIERDIRLPPDAYSIDAYSRVYAYAPGDTVVAIYLLPEKPDQKLCEEEKVIEARLKSKSASRFCPPPDGLIAGERRWISDYRMLPGASDGGCVYVDVEYDLNSQKLMHVECHGRID